MRTLFFIIFVNLYLISQAQISYSNFPIPYSSSAITEKDKNGFFVAQKIKGNLSGTGLYKFKNGTLYIGDFKNKKPNGFGMFICPIHETISNYPNAQIYVGRFKDGLKRGKGVCYNSDGEIIYSGKFDNDSPVPTPLSTNDGSRFFSDFKTDDFYYIGEFKETNPDGFGAVFFSNGDILISNFQDGQRTGINIYLEHDGNWISENVENGKSSFISSSREYASFVAGSKSTWNAAWKKALGNLDDWSKALNDLSIQLSTITQNTDENYGGVSQAYNSSGYSSGINGTHSGSGKNNISEQRAYNQDKSTYSKYDSMLSQVFAGNRNASSSEIKQWQNKMKKLRKKWEGSGKNFPYSSNEDK